MCAKLSSKEHFQRDKAYFRVKAFIPLLLSAINGAAAAGGGGGSAESIVPPSLYLFCHPLAESCVDFKTSFYKSSQKGFRRC